MNCKTENCANPIALPEKYCGSCMLKKYVKHENDCHISHKICKSKAWQLYSEKEPKDYDTEVLTVRGTCNNPKCIKSEHLALMTKKDANELNKKKSAEALKAREEYAEARAQEGYRYCHECTYEFNTNTNRDGHADDHFCTVLCCIRNYMKSGDFLGHCGEIDYKQCWIPASIYKNYDGNYKIYYDHTYYTPQEIGTLLACIESNIKLKEDGDEKFGCILNKICMNPTHYEEITPLNELMHQLSKDDSDYFIKNYKITILNNLIELVATQNFEGADKWMHTQYHIETLNRINKYKN